MFINYKNGEVVDSLQYQENMEFMGSLRLKSEGSGKVIISSEGTRMKSYESTDEKLNKAIKDSLMRYSITDAIERGQFLRKNLDPLYYDH